MRINNTTRLLAAALATLGATSAHAVVEMYGTVFPFFEQVHTGGSTPAPAAASRPSMLPASAYGADDPTRWRMSAGTSAWGFRGDEDLGPGVKLVWQLESGFQPDQNTGPGLSGRNSKVGFQCAVGEIFLGQWDSPYKYTTLNVNPLRGGYVFDFTGIIGNPGQGVPATTTQFQRNGKADAAFDRRNGNTVQYWSPKVLGLQARVAYTVSEGTGPVTAGGPVIKPDIWSASVVWEEGPISLRYAAEVHNDYFGMSQLGGSAAGTATNRSSKDRAQKASVTWRIGNTRLAGLYEQLKYSNNDNTVGAIRGFERDAYYGIIEQRFGNNSLWAAYGKAYDGMCNRTGGGSCNTSQMGAQFWAIGWIYRFSRRTEVFAAYYNLNNAMNGTYSPQPIVGPTIAAGADTTGGGVGILHFF